MRAFILFLLLLSLPLFSFSKTSGTGIPPNESKTIGNKLPDIELVNSEGKLIRLSELSGKPIILNPIYTHCESACPLMTKELKKVIPLVGEPGKDFYILSLTFDPQDTMEDLRRFASYHGIKSDGWFVVKAKDKSWLFKLLDAIDFRFATIPDREFVHPNILVFISGNLEVMKYLYGVNYDPLDMRIALSIAKGEESFLAKVKPYLFFVGFLGLLTTSVFLIFLLSRKKLITNTLKEAQ